jgi:hypothetical protein
MKLNIELDGIQEGKNYNFSFCLTSNGEIVATSTTSSKDSAKSVFTDLKDQKPEIDAPVLGEPPKKEFKVESSFKGKINPN